MLLHGAVLTILPGVEVTKAATSLAQHIRVAISTPTPGPDTASKPSQSVGETEPPGTAQRDFENDVSIARVAATVADLAETPATAASATDAKLPERVVLAAATAVTESSIAKVQPQTVHITEPELSDHVTLAPAMVAADARIAEVQPQPELVPEATALEHVAPASANVSVDPEIAEARAPGARAVEAALREFAAPALTVSTNVSNRPVVLNRKEPGSETRFASSAAVNAMLDQREHGKEPLVASVERAVRSGTSGGSLPGATEPKVAGEASPSAVAVHNASRLAELLHIAIGKRKHYPAIARRQRREGTTTVSFSLAPNGDLDQVDVDRSSGFQSLDAAALTAVSQVAPFGPARDLLSATHRFKVNVVFNLE